MANKQIKTATQNTTKHNSVTITFCLVDELSSLYDQSVTVIVEFDQFMFLGRV